MVAKRGNPQIFLVGITTTAFLLIIWNSQSNMKPTMIFRRSDYSDLPSFTDSQMEEYVRTFHVTPPSILPYNFTHPGSGHNNGYSNLVFEVFGNTTPGVFLEAGAFDGEEASNTLHLEQMGWKGILVECNPWSLPKLRSKNRKAWIADVCLSTTGKAGFVKIYSAPEWPSSAQINRQLSLDEMKMHGIDWMKNKTWEEYERPSFPLHSVVAAVGEFPAIDFLSLDVQGAEIGILKHYAFDKFPIKLIVAEVFTFNEPQRDELVKFLASKGYKLYKNLGADYAFLLN